MINSLSGNHAHLQRLYCLYLRSIQTRIPVLKIPPSAYSVNLLAAGKVISAFCKDNDKSDSSSKESCISPKLLTKDRLSNFLTKDLETEFWQPQILFLPELSKSWGPGTVSGYFVESGTDASRPTLTTATLHLPLVTRLTRHNPTLQFDSSLVYISQGIIVTTVVCSLQIP